MTSAHYTNIIFRSILPKFGPRTQKPLFWDMLHLKDYDAHILCYRIMKLDTKCPEMTRIIQQHYWVWSFYLFSLLQAKSVKMTHTLSVLHMCKCLVNPAQREFLPNLVAVSKSKQRSKTTPSWLRERHFSLSSRQPRRSPTQTCPPWTPSTPSAAGEEHRTGQTSPAHGLLQWLNSDYNLRLL